MAMTRQLWTLNGLATELGKDRRTLGRALRHVPADGTTRGGYQGWFMETALRALSRTGQASGEDASTPPGFEEIDRVENPVDKAQRVTLMCLIYRIGPLAASMAVLAGAPMKVARDARSHDRGLGDGSRGNMRCVEYWQVRFRERSRHFQCRSI